MINDHDDTRDDTKDDINATIDWNAFLKAQSNRWLRNSDHVTYCQLHGTYFYERDEPCRGCYDEFKKEVK